ncbi:MAG: hypothetical protein CMH52_00530 [Myxococcales bacterium]|nr:hypothetical protein [Myxococcales bacterium]
MSINQYSIGRILVPALLLSWACQDQQQAPVASVGPPGFNQSDVGVLGDSRTNSADMGTMADLSWAEDMAQVEDAAPDSAPFEVIPFAVETRVGERRTAAGIENRITCQVLDQVGEPIAQIRARPEIYPDTGFERTESGAIGRIARDYSVVCSANSLGLRDPTPAIWTVTPARPVRTVTRMSRPSIDAGETVDIECEAFDEFGNRTGDENFEVQFSPPPRNLDRRGMTFRVDGAGTFGVACQLPGVEFTPALSLQVKAGLPAGLRVARFPERPIYRVGSVLELVPQVSDQFGNTVSGAPIEFASEPALPTFGDGRFQCVQEGEYTLSVRVLGETWEDRDLVEEIRILVDYGGPGVDCVSPEMGQVIAIPPGGVHRLSGTVADIAGVESLTVDGVAANLQDDGRWSAEVPAEWGLNVHDIIASDGENETSTFCAYYASDRFAAADLPHLDALQLRLGQGSLDDGAPSAPIRSLADVLRRVINSQGLEDTVDRSAAAQNPLVPSECRARVLGICLFRLGVEYRSYENNGPNLFELNLVDRGLRIRVAFREQNVNAKLNGTLGNRVRMRAEHITLDMTFDVGLRGNGQPDITLRNLNGVQVGDLDADFSGILGFLLELVFEAFEGLIRDTITDAIRDFLTDNIDRVLTDLLSNVDIGELAQGFNIPSLTGGPDLRLSINASLGRLDFVPGSATIGVNTGVSGPDVIAAPGIGVPLIPGEDVAAVPDGRSVGALIKLGLLNQIMYRLWRGGYFEAEGGGLVEGLGEDLPDGTEVFLRFPQPPWVVGVDGESTVRVMVGPLSAGVVHPDFFVDPIRVRLAAIIEAGVEIQGERDIAFQRVRIDAFHLSLAGAEIPDRARQVLEDTLTRVIQQTIDQALNDGLPTLPLPDFVIPDDLQEFELPPGVPLGLRQPRLFGVPAAWIFDGNFGE